MGRQYQLGIYEKAMPSGLSFEQMLACAHAGGFDSLEISIDETEERLSRLEWTPLEKNEVRKASLDTGVPILTMCLSGHRRFSLGSREQVVRERSLEIMRKALDLAGVIGVRIIQLAGYDVYYEQGDGESRKWFLQNLWECAQLAAKSGVMLGFETMETAFMDTVAKAMSYVVAIKSPFLGVYPDIGNLKNASVLYGTDLLIDLQAGKGHIMAAHLKETKPGIYRDLAFGTGHTEYEVCIDLLFEMGVRLFVGECWHQPGEDHPAVLREASAFLRAKIEGVLAKNAGSQNA